MLDGTTTRFSHVKDGQTPWRSDGLRDFFLYRDLGIEDGHRRPRARATRQGEHGTRKRAPAGTAMRRTSTSCIMLKGWARFMYGDQETLVEAGDCVHQRPGIVHYLFDYSPDMEYLEIVGPADFKTIDVPAPCAVPGAEQRLGVSQPGLRTPCRALRSRRARAWRRRSTPSSRASP